MSLVKCKFCAEEIQEAAIICKNCFKSQEEPKRSKWIYVVSAALAFSMIVFVAGLKIGNQTQEGMPNGNIQAESENESFSVFLDFDDQGVTDVVQREMYFSAEQQSPGPVIFYTCSQAAAEKIYFLGDSSETNVLGVFTILRLSIKANLLKSDSSLLAISDKTYPVLTGGRKCSYVFEFENVKFDGLPFFFDLGEYGVKAMPINPNDVINGEVRIRMNRLKLVTILP